MSAYDCERTNEPEWKPLFSGIAAVSRWLGEQRPDHLVVLTNDHMTQFDLVCWPTFAIGVVDEYPIADEGRGVRPLPPIPADSTFSASLAQLMVTSGIDIAISRRYEADHGVHSPLWLLDPNWRWPVTLLHVNTIIPPLPNSRRVWEFGKKLAEAIGHISEAKRVAIIALGGLSHQLSGPTFGTVNAEWDRYCLDAIVRNPVELLSYRTEEIEQHGGTEGLELYHWLAARSALGDDPQAVVGFYYPFGIMGYAGIGFAPSTVYSP